MKRGRDSWEDSRGGRHRSLSPRGDRRSPSRNTWRDRNNSHQGQPDSDYHRQSHWMPRPDEQPYWQGGPPNSGPSRPGRKTLLDTPLVPTPPVPPMYPAEGGQGSPGTGPPRGPPYSGSYPPERGYGEPHEGSYPPSIPPPIHRSSDPYSGPPSRDGFSGPPPPTRGGNGWGNDSSGPPPRELSLYRVH